MEYGYGFDSISLRCEPANEEDSFIWQMGAEAYPQGMYQDGSAFKAAWESAHPDRVIHALEVRRCDDIHAHIFPHHACDIRLSAAAGSFFETDR